ncbi:MAG: ABC transporter substrate-binding protein [Bauldia sp.]|nr:ABC transporter substrate-binding protein [Bauldia sp.]MCW5716472.1 ABC transporter substrate-binding protein [Bauldia sp.]
MFNPSRRQLLALGGAAASSSLLPFVARAQDAQRIHVGTVFPAATGLSTVRTSINDYPGTGARNGVILAESVIGQRAAAAGHTFDVLLGSSPSTESAIRTTERLIEAQGAVAIIGGVGAGQAEVISDICEAARVPFFNVGSSNDALRGDSCRRYTFHIEPSAAMFLDAIATWGASQGYRNWFVLYENNPEGERMMLRAAAAIEQHGAGGTVAAAAGVDIEQPVYINEANAIGRSNADVLLLLVNPIDQIAFLNQIETYGHGDVPALTFPDVISQTRDYIASARLYAQINNPRYRFSAWDTTKSSNDAASFNDAYVARWSEPADPTAWAAYHAVKILYETIVAVDSTDPEAIVDYLESPDTVFDVLKGPETSFRPWDHQLRQPIEVVRIDQEVTWVRAEVQTRIAIAQVETELPAATAGDDVIARLDTFGDGPGGAICGP